MIDRHTKKPSIHLLVVVELCRLVPAFLPHITLEQNPLSSHILGSGDAQIKVNVQFTFGGTKTKRNNIVSFRPQQVQTLKKLQ